MGSMKWKIIVVAAFLVVVGGIAVGYRGELRDRLFELQKPSVPVAVPYTKPAEKQNALAVEQPSLVEGGVATSQNYLLVSSPPAAPAPSRVDPTEKTGALPSEANLAVPFTSQAPFQNWDLPYQEACEEASAIMVDAFYRGVIGSIPREDAKKAIDDLVAFEMRTLGYYKDTTAAETAKFMREFFSIADVRVVPFERLEEVKRVVANGYPVILPAAGKLLHNPFFRGDGPLYHMLVVKGYTKDGKIITNDPGTRRGAEYLYDPEVLLNAVHDWNGGNVNEGARVMIVVMPKSS